MHLCSMQKQTMTYKRESGSGTHRKSDLTTLRMGASREGPHHPITVNAQCHSWFACLQTVGHNLENQHLLFSCLGHYTFSHCFSSCLTWNMAEELFCVLLLRQDRTGIRSHCWRPIQWRMTSLEEWSLAILEWSCVLVETTALSQHQAGNAKQVFGKWKAA